MDIYDDVTKIEETLFMTPPEEEIDEDDVFNSKVYDDFDERAWKKGDGYKIPKFPIIEKQLEGLESGLYIFAGESNSGKTALMMNVLKDICSCEENNLFGIYYSLDDTKNVVIPRIIAMEQRIPIGVAAKPQRYRNIAETSDTDTAILYESYLTKRKEGLDKLKSEIDIFKIVDGLEISNHEQLEAHMKKMKTAVKAKWPDKNIVIAIDSIYDIQLTFNAEDKSKSEFIAKFVKSLSVELDCVILASAHLRKLNGNRRPTVDDLKEANTLLYEADMVWLVYNDVSKNKNAAKIYWENGQEKGPVIELDWAKNKKSSFKGRTFCKFAPNMSLTAECNDSVNNYFDQLIYQI